jgi:transposase
VSDYIGARALLSGLPNVKWLLGDRGYDAAWFREAFQDKGIRACIPSRKQRKTPVKYDKRRYKRRNRIEIMFGRLKEWRRVATRYDRCPKVFLPAIALAALVIYWLRIMALMQQRDHHRQAGLPGAARCVAIVARTSGAPMANPTTPVAHTSQDWPRNSVHRRGTLPAHRSEPRCCVSPGPPGPGVRRGQADLTFWVCTPSPSMPRRITSPGLR